MTLSVVIVAYNVKEYIEQAIQSCLNQKCHFEYEIIIGDDGSDDGTIEIIEYYVKKYPGIIKYFVMDRTDIKDVIPSIRITNIFKKAFSLATGDYISCMSGDDIFCSNKKFQMQVEFLENNDKYISCYTDYKKFWNNGDEQEIKNKKTKSRNLFWSGSYVHISCFVFRKAVLDSLLDRFCDDTGLCFSILKTGKSYYFSEVTFAYRQRDLSIMHVADELELCILEMLLFQDIINEGGLYLSSMARFFKPFKYCFKLRKRLTDVKYKKYIESGSKYNNDILGMMKVYDERKADIYIKLLGSGMAYIIFWCIRKVNSAINKLKKVAKV